MDNRRRFLYCVAAELWGRMREPCAGGWKARRKRGRQRGGKSPRMGRCRDAERRESSEAWGARAKKSRYSPPRTRTVDRHRWMGRGSQGRREKHCQGTRQNGPVTSGEGAPARAGRREEAQATV